MVRWAFFAAVVLGALSALGARCIENVAVRQDAAGYTYLLGEIFNDTDVQGTRMVIRASLLDGDGNVIASKDTTTCPPDLQPHGSSSYGVRFDQPNLPPYAFYDVRPISGKTLDAPLPDTGISVVQQEARRAGGGIEVDFRVKNNSSRSYVSPQLCAVAYDVRGKVASWSPFDPKEYVSGTTLRPGATVDLSFSLRDQPPENVNVRVWLWIPGSEAGTSPYQPVAGQQLPVSP